MVEEALDDTEQSIYLFNERCRKLIGNYENNDRISGEIFFRYIDKEFLTIIVQMFWTDEALKNDYYGAAEPPVRCGESHLSGLTEPSRFFII